MTFCCIFVSKLARNCVVWPILSFFNRLDNNVLVENHRLCYFDRQMDAIEISCCRLGRVFLILFVKSHLNQTKSRKINRISQITSKNLDVPYYEISIYTYYSLSRKKVPETYVWQSSGYGPRIRPAYPCSGDVTHRKQTYIQREIYDDKAKSWIQRMKGVSTPY